MLTTVFFTFLETRGNCEEAIIYHMLLLLLT